LKEDQSATQVRTNLYDYAPSEITPVLQEVVAQPFRARQVSEWLFEKGVESFSEMTNLPLDLRAKLAERFDLVLPRVVSRTDPAPDDSRKYLFSLGDAQLIEAVYMPMAHGRTTFCLSSQAGCAVGCTFCVTGFFGAGRNLTPSEILGQVVRLRKEHDVPWEQLNLVFMGMGEPLLNLDNVLASLEALYPNVAPKRITLSTSGITPGIRELAELDVRPNLAVSINAPDQRRREEIMPITKKYPIDELIDALHDFPLEKGRDLTAEYVLLAGYNDSAEDARALARLLRRLRVKVNAIPFNPDPNLPDWMKRPDDRSIDRFVSVLVRERIPVTVRRSKGNEIAAACGQLRGKTERKRRPRSDD
jgi:23S rRNA (adenine2503-C2)-methyltransferase